MSEDLDNTYLVRDYRDHGHGRLTKPQPSGDLVRRAVWDEFREFLQLTAVGTVYSNLPGEDMLPNIRMWASSQWPVRW